MNVCFNGYNEGIVTFEADDTVKTGMPVEMSANGKVKATNSTAFCGICVGVRDGYAAVQLDGYVKVKYTGTLSVGYSKLSGNSDGTIQSDAENGRDVLVVDVDTVGQYAGIIL